MKMHHSSSVAWKPSYMSTIIMNYLKCIMVLTLFCVHIQKCFGKAYRKFPKFDRNVTKTFGVTFVDIQDFHGPKDLSCDDGCFPFQTVVLQTTSVVDEIEHYTVMTHNINILQKLEDIIPHTTQIGLQDAHLLSWLPDYLKQKNGERRYMNVMDINAAIGEDTLDKVKTLTELGCDTGVIVDLIEINSTIRDQRLQELQTLIGNSASLICFKSVLIQNSYYDYDSLSRYLDNTQSEETRTNLKVCSTNSNSKVGYIIRLDQDYVGISQGKLTHYEQLLARFSYTWGNERNQTVWFYYSKPKHFGGAQWFQMWIQELFDENHSPVPVNVGNESCVTISSLHKSLDRYRKVYETAYRSDMNEIMLKFFVLESPPGGEMASYMTLLDDTMKTILWNEKSTGKNCSASLVLQINVENPGDICDFARIIWSKNAKYPNKIKKVIIGFCVADFDDLYESKNYETVLKQKLSRDLYCLNRLKSLNIQWGIKACDIIGQPSLPKEWFHEEADYIFYERYARDQNLYDFTADQTFGTTLFKELHRITQKVVNEFGKLDMLRVTMLGTECFEQNRIWDALHNFAKVHYISYLYWIIENIPGFPLDESKSLQRVGNLYDFCVVVDDFPPSDYFSWSGQAGVSFHLNKSPFNAFSESQISSFLRLLHAKFKSVEFILESGHEPVLNKLSTSVALYKKLSKGEVMDYDYYIDITSFVGKNITITEFDSSLVGVHFEIKNSQSCPSCFSSTISNDLRVWIESVQKMKVKVGFVIQFKNWSTPDGLYRELLVACDYMVFEVNMIAVIDAHYAEQNVSISTKILSPEEDRRFKKLLYVWFENLRALKRVCEQINPNAKLILKTMWPTNGQENLDKFLRFWSYVNEMSTSFKMPFFVHEAFDEVYANQTDDELRFGWYRARNLSALSDPRSYVELVSDYYGLPTLYPEFPKTKKTYWLHLSILFSSAIITVIIIIVFLVTRLRQKSEIIKDFELIEFRNGKAGGDRGSQCHIFGEKYDTEAYEIRKDEFFKDEGEILGIGHFGVVYKSRMARFGTDVAVKVPQLLEKDKDKRRNVIRSFLYEIKIMSHIGEHRNVLRLLGAYTVDIKYGDVFIVTEFCENGSLLEMLQKMNVSAQNENCLYEMCRYCHEIAGGMYYLATKNVIHGDLRAQNILLDKYRICKISDFGLSIKLDHYKDIFVKESHESLPAAWMAVESLSTLEFTLKSDIWSMGVTFWEIFSYGARPYLGEKINAEFLEKLRRGMRLKKPILVTDEIFEEIHKCWELNPESRPHPIHFYEFFDSMRDMIYQKC